MSVNTIPIRLEKTWMLSSTVKHFVFTHPDNAPFDYLPGQFITIHFERNGTLIRRSYSIANPPENNNRIEIAAGFVEQGPGTELLFQLKEGDCITINGPFGRLILKDDDPKRYIMAATSTGITPYRSMIPELKRRVDANPHLQVIILLGAQKHEDVLYCDEFLALAEYSPRMTFRAQLSRETDENLAHHEHKGYVQDAFTDLALNPNDDRVYLCGNPSMIDDAFDRLKNKGFAIQNVIREKYISR